MTDPKTMDRMILSLKAVGAYYWRNSGLFHRDRYWALQNVDMELKRGETLGVIGRNGAGKSTLLRIMAGIMAPDKGTMVKRYEYACLLSIQAGFNPHLSGRLNAIMNGMLLGIPRQDIEARMEEIISFAELEYFIDQPIHTYSTGMKTRLGFAVALQAKPELLLIDEVISVGDAAFQIKSAQAMSEWIKSEQTVVLVSHNPDIVKRFCDRVVWVENGVTLLEGQTDEIIRCYQDDVKQRVSEQGDADNKLIIDN